MAYVRHFKIGDTTYDVNIAESNLVVTRSVTTLTTDLAAGTSFTVPAHIVGSDKLKIYLDGVLCVRGQQYTDEDATTIKFLDDILSGWEIQAESLTVN